MNRLAEEILSYYGISDILLNDDELLHYGIPRRSGRYPYGSGENPFQHSGDFLGRIKDLKDSNFTYTDDEGTTWSGDNAIAKSMGLTTTEFRRQVSWANYDRRLQEVATAKSLREDGLGYTEIGRKMGKNESTIRSLLDSGREDKMNQVMETVDLLRSQVEEKGMIDVGSDVARELGISKERLDMAVDYLNKAEDCPVYKGGIPQPTNPGQQTNQRVLCLPGTEHKEIYDYSRVKTINEYVSSDDGETYQKKFTYPESLDSKRLQIRYNEEGGIEKDGIIELRRGVADLDLKGARYSQVRIMVDGTHYLKGMAVYSDDMPDGVDVVFNTNKTKGTAMGDVLKKIKEDPDNPFGSLIKDADKGGQYWYNDPKTGEKKLGLINKRADEGDWEEWANAIPSQFLGKQNINLAKKQLNLAKTDKLAEYEEICNLTNPTIKKHLLEKFADECDSAAVNLKAAALPGQKYHVIIPINTLKDNEIYAPNYENGTKLALIRYPHGGLFEIPILTVNNKHKPAQDLLGNDVVDAAGINHKVAEQLSGADFDGDTVMCIPTHDKKGNVKISNKAPLEELKGFDPKVEYGGTPTTDANGKVHYLRNGVEYPIMKNTGTEMGKISNLITDMTLAGASDDKLARAVKHSMVVIDAEKHKLDYKQSYIDNNIEALKKEYQKKDNGDYGGAATILSRAKGEESVLKRQGSYKVNMPGTEDYDPTRPDGAKLWKVTDDLYYPERSYDKKTKIMTVKTTDGKKVSFDVTDPVAYEKYSPSYTKTDPLTGEVTYTNKDGSISYKTKARTQESTRMAETDDAMSLVSTSQHPMELVYADYANSMKALGNQARIELKTTGKLEYSSTAKNIYKNEVDSLNAKLNNALLNSTRERDALRRANAEIAEKKKKYAEEHDGAEMKPGDLKKASQQAVTKYRQKVKSVARRDRNIDISDKEWEAIQAGAVSENTLKKILNNTDIDTLRNKAMPKTTGGLSTAQINRIKALSASNYTLSEIAKKMGVSTSTVSNYLKGKGVN